MKQTVFRTAAFAGLAFAAGFAVARGPLAVGAQTPTPAPSVVPMAAAFVPDITKLETKPAPPCFPNARVADISVGTPAGTAATVQYLTGGTIPAHYHATATEVQYVIAGSGREWFGKDDKRFGPRTVFVVPPGTLHAGIVKDRRSPPVSLLVIKVPTQASNDNRFRDPPPAHC
jgi:quercetin dioxygenase-like cupin family protein